MALALRILKVWALIGSASLPAIAAVGNVLVQTTSTQAVLWFTVTDPAQCTVQIFSYTQLGQLADDANPNLFPGAQQCNRAGATFDGTTVTFVAGLRRAALASDGKMHSRALTAETPYYYLITDTADNGTAQGSFTTDAPPAGNLYPEQPPFDANAWDNRAYPQFDWTPAQRNQLLTDPTTGLLVKRTTFASDAYAYTYSDADGGLAPLAAGAITGGDCADRGNLNTAGRAYATCTGTATVFMPLPAFQMSGTGTFNNWYPRFNVDDLILYLYGTADVAAARAKDGSETIAICLAQGANLPCLSKQFNVVLKKTTELTGTVKIPGSTPAPVFANWGFTPLHGDVVPTPGTVSVNWNTVVLTNPGQATTYANEFNIDWPAGSQIYIAGSSAWGCLNDYCTIASIQSAVQLTTVETCSSGCPNSATYEGRAFGFKIVRLGGSGSVQLSFGYEAAMSTSWSVLEDGFAQHCNSTPVTVSTDPNGTPYPGYTLQGYVCTFQHEWSGLAFWLFISKDQNGAPLGEARPLGPVGIPYSMSWNSNGALFPNGVSMQFAGWDPANGGRFLGTASYNSGATELLVAGSYDTTKPGCSPAYANWSGYLQYIPMFHYPPDTCFTYTNLTNPTANPPMDLRSQIVRAYANFNPGVDLSGFGVGEVVAAGGFARTCLTAAGGGDRSFKVCGTFDSTTGNLVQVFDSFSRYPGRWGYVHGPIHTLGKFHSLTPDQPYPASASVNNVLYGPFEMAVTAVNRAGFGQPPNWTQAGVAVGTSIATREAYGCPTGIPQFLIDQGAAANHCIQVRVSSEPCSHTPGSQQIYPDGKAEAQQFPCTSTDGSTVINPAWSKLQNMAVGDWVRQNETYNDYGENFIIATKDVIAPNQIEMWLIRGGGVWPNNAQKPYATIGGAHPDGFSLAMTANWIIGAADWVMDATVASATWVPDNPAWSLIHGTNSLGSNPNNKTAIGIDLQDQGKLAGFYDTPVSQQVMRPLPDLTVRNPVWAGSASGYAGPIQDYMNNDQVNADSASRRWVVNYRHINPASGNGPEYRTAVAPNGTPALAPVPGTTQVYKIADPYSGGPADPKNVPFTLFAGRFLLRDISGPVTSQHTITDQTNFSACYALHAGECRTDSNAGDRYVSVPFAAGQNQCLVNQYEEVAPCFFNAVPVVGKIQQADVSGPFDATGARQRMLPAAFTGIGGQYQFSEPKMSPDGAWMFLPCWWLNGVRSDVCAEYLPTLPPPDGVVRHTFVPFTLSLPGQSGDMVRVCWGYAENGPVDGSPGSLFPTSRRERGCSIGAAPAASTTQNRAANSAPFAWASELPQYAACDTGCSVQMQLIPGRVAYFIIERVNSGQVTTSPVGVAVQK
jgi:hypothetical protein